MIYLNKYRPHFKRTLDIAGPCIFENIMVSIVSFVDTIMVGSLGAVATAAVAINASPIWFLNNLPVMLAVGGMAMSARFVGAKDLTSANKLATQTMSIGFAFSAAVMLLMVFVSKYVPLWLGAQEDVLPYATKYIRIYSFAIMFHFSGLVASGLLRGAGNTKTPMFISLAANLLNVCGNFFLIFPVRTITLMGLSFTIWGAGLGVIGAAVSTAFSQSVAGIILVLCLFGKRQPVHIEPKNLFKIDRQLIGKVFKIGLPAAFERLFITSGQLFFQRTISSLGTIQIAAHYLGTTAESIAYMPAYGFSTASTTLIGQSLGAKEEENAVIYSRINLFFGFCVGILCGIAFFFFPHILISWFTPDLNVIKEGAGALKIMGVVQPLFCVSITIIGILRGAGDTKLPLVAAVAGMWGVRLGAAWFFVYVTGLGLKGAWYGMALDITVRTIILTIRYMRKKWLNIKI